MLSGRNILIVEDEYFLADDLAKMTIELGGHVLGPFADTDNVKYEMNQIDLAFLNINLGNNKDVYPLAWRLRLAHVPFIFITGYNRRAIKAEFQGFPMIRKDRLSRDVLADAVSTFVPPFNLKRCS